MSRMTVRAVRCSADDGATAVEYAIMASAIAAVIVGAVYAVGTSTFDLFNRLMSAWGG